MMYIFQRPIWVYLDGVEPANRVEADIPLLYIRARHAPEIAKG